MAIIGKIVKGEFSAVSGSTVRIVRDSSGAILGTIHKVLGGYRVVRVDGKVRQKVYLADAFKTVARAN